MTDNATGEQADAERTADAQDGAITFTPITVPDAAARERGRRRRRLLGGIVAVVAVAGGITAWAVAANSGDGKPTKHTAVIPKAFGAYTQAKPADSLWESIGGDNLDFSKGEALVTYTAAGGKAAKISIEMDPAIDLAPGSDSDPAVSLLTGSDVKTGSVTSHPAGAVGGTIKCVDVAVGEDRGFTECAWQDKAVAVTLVPVLNKQTVISASTAADLRAFLAALKVEPKKD
ncbi:hypothetical protein [Actinacidiphila yeochonensis]|uniref:hypothetical protein n=1 Tax=Actinacidiphila yeochonensis TaxID=89050 RepID=UPI00056C6CF7|nr:hypothetical protein [Actinacidiphila yeochonensis]